MLRFNSHDFYFSKNFRKKQLILAAFKYFQLQLPSAQHNSVELLQVGEPLSEFELVQVQATLKNLKSAATPFLAFKPG